MRPLLLTAALVTTACYHAPVLPDPAIVHTDRVGYHHAYWHDPTIIAAHARGEVPLASIVPAGAELIDLSHTFDDQTLYWPSEKHGFERHGSERPRAATGGYYASGRVSLPEHAGTHVDAPSHFAEGKQTADRLPLPRLMARAVVIDMVERANANPDAQLEVADLDAFEATHGVLEPGTIVMVRSGWSSRWPNRKRYMGDDRTGATDRLHFPGISADAARRLVERDVAAVGIDTASVDHGPSTTFDAHRIFAEADVPTFENVARLNMVPLTGAVVIALPMKIGGGSGGPARIVAVVPR